MGGPDVATEPSVVKSSKKKSRKKRMAPQQEEENDAQVTNDIAHGTSEDADGIQIDDNDELTMADKLASLDLQKNLDTEAHETIEPPQTQPPSADSVHVLLRQALHADDRALLLECLYNQDEKVISNSVSLLRGVEIFKLFDSLMSIVQYRGAVLLCALPWLKSLLLQHYIRMMSPESASALNSFFQEIDSRVANMNPAVNLASNLDLLDAGVDDDGVDEYDSVPPVIYEDKDDSEEEESELDAMETDDEETNELDDYSGLSDADLSEDFSD